MTDRKAPRRRRAEAEAPAAETAAAGPPVQLGPLTDAVGFYLRLAQEASFQDFHDRGRHLRLRPGRFAALVIVSENPGISQAALSRAVGRDTSSLTPMLDELERRDLIRRERVPENRRSYALSLTPKGHKWLAKLMDPMRLHERALDRIIGDDRTVFLRVLKRIASSLA